MNAVALIPAAGVGSRFGATIPKQYVEIEGKSVLQHTVEILAAESRIACVAVVASAEDEWIATQKLPEKAKVFRVGGEERAQTVYNGLVALRQAGLIVDDTPVLVHDAARCCLPAAALSRLLDHLCDEGALLAIPVADTLKRANAQNGVEHTVSRQNMWQAQTPQLFYAALLEKALSQADLSCVTDESSAVEQLGIQPRLVLGDNRNMKLTRAEDAALVAFLLQQQKSAC